MLSCHALYSRITAGVPEHVRVRLERKFRLYASSLDHTSEPGGAERRPHAPT
jgi:hypothetical protein